MNSLCISQRAQSIKPSPTLAVTARAARLRAAGKDIISLGAGEPDFDTPEHIKEAAIAALHSGKTRYTPVDGTAELKQAVVDKLQRENGLHYTQDQVSVASGAKHSLYNLFQALLNPKDEVLIPSPYWVSYPDMAVLAGARPVILDTSIQQGFTLTPELLRAALNTRTRLLVLNSPGNPTGNCYTRETLRTLGEVLQAHPEVWVVSDDIYEHILWGQEDFVNILNACPELAERCVVVNGVSKAYAMTGWRIGYAAGPAPVIKAMNRIQSQSTSNACSISQAAAATALNGDQSCVREYTKIFQQRHDFVHDALQDMEGVNCVAAQGTFYVFPEVRSLLERHANVDNDVQLAEYFLEQAGVATVPGSAFGAPGHMRLSFATDMDTLRQAMARIAEAVKSL